MAATAGRRRARRRPRRRRCPPPARAGPAPPTRVRIAGGRGRGRTERQGARRGRGAPIVHLCVVLSAGPSSAAPGPRLPPYLSGPSGKSAALPSSPRHGTPRVNLSVGRHRREFHASARSALDLLDAPLSPHIYSVGPAGRGDQARDAQVTGTITGCGGAADHDTITQQSSHHGPRGQYPRSCHGRYLEECRMGAPARRRAVRRRDGRRRDRGFRRVVAGLSGGGEALAGGVGRGGGVEPARRQRAGARRAPRPATGDGAPAGRCPRPHPRRTGRARRRRGPAARPAAARRRAPALPVALTGAADLPDRPRARNGGGPDPAAPPRRAPAHPDRPRRGGQDAPGPARRRGGARRLPRRRRLRAPGADLRPRPGGRDGRGRAGPARGRRAPAARHDAGLPTRAGDAAGARQPRTGRGGSGARRRPVAGVPCAACAGDEPRPAAGGRRARVPRAAAGPARPRPGAPPRGRGAGAGAGGAPAHGAGAARQARPRAHPAERRRGRRDLPPPGRAAAGHRARRRPGQGVAAGRAAGAP